MFCLISKRMCCRNRFPENRRAKQNSVPEKQRVGIFSLFIPRATNRSGFRKKTWLDIGKLVETFLT